MVLRRGSKGTGAGKKEAPADGSKNDAAEKRNEDAGPTPAKVKEEPSTSTGEIKIADPPVIVDPETTQQEDPPAARDSDTKEEQRDSPKELSGESPSPPVESGAEEGAEAGEAGEGPQAALPEPKTETVTNVAETDVKPQPSSLGVVVEPKGGSTPPREPQDAPGVGVGAERVREEEKPVVEEGGDSSDEEEDDGFRVVVGRDAAPPVAPAAPVKRFLRGTNTLVNNTAATSGGAESSRGPAASAKPVSAAAGIASLVPSKGAPVAAARPSLKPGEYPPTAELQNEAGRTAFDVDIDGMEEQPWRHPGVDIADFFNYGFTEDPWRVYCEKQLRNRYDQTLGRSKNAKGNSLRVGGGGGGSHMRHGTGGGMRRGGGRLGGQERPAQFHNNGSDRPKFSSHGPPPGSAWGPGQGQDRFPPHGFGSGLPPGGNRGSSPPPWLDGPQQAHPGNRQKFGPGPAGGQGRGGGGVKREGGVGGMGRSRSPGSRDGPGDKMPRLR